MQTVESYVNFNKILHHDRAYYFKEHGFLVGLLAGLPCFCGCQERESHLGRSHGNDEFGQVNGPISRLSGAVRREDRLRNRQTSPADSLLEASL